MKCPKCGYNIPRKKLASDMGKKGGSVSSETKRQAAKDREARKRDEKAKGANVLNEAAGKYASMKTKEVDTRSPRFIC